MKFPGRRNHKHYFPIDDKKRASLTNNPFDAISSTYIVGIDQLLVDIEVEVDFEFMKKHDFPIGESFLINDKLADKLYAEFKEKAQIKGEFPGGAIGNTLHNFCVLSDTKAIALGAIEEDIKVGDYAYNYLCKTHSLVDLTHLQSSSLPMGRALCFITPDRERTFAISKGCMNSLTEEGVLEDVVANTSVLLISAYTLRGGDDPIVAATMKAVEIAKKNNVPVVLSLGTSNLVREHREMLINFIRNYVNCVAMNEKEAYELTLENDIFISMDSILELCDLTMITVGAKGIYLGGYCDESALRATERALMSESVTNFNQFEYSRSMRKNDCVKPVKIYTHMNPFNGGPSLIKNTNGAGDAALSAVLHDFSANNYHRQKMPNSPKHDKVYLTYSSLSQIAKYANRVSFEVLNQSSPRLVRSLTSDSDPVENISWSL
jgi:inosine kinase